MKHSRLALSAMLLAASSALAFAQPAPQSNTPAEQRGRMMRFSPEDAAAFAEARIAGLKAGLKLTADQEKHWPAFEAALREQAKARADRMAERRAEWASRARPQAGEQRPVADPIQRLRRGAEFAQARAAQLTKLADAAEPLVKSLDDGQKRRFNALARIGGGDGMRRGMRHGR